jgi:predicted DNA-binding WGR domain protein
VQIHLRYDNPDGTQKDWIGEANQFGVNIQWGRRGQVNQGIQIPVDRCYPTPQDELLNRAAKKKAKGYREAAIVRTVEGNLPPQLDDEIRKVKEVVKEVVSNTPGTPPRSLNQALAEWAKKTDPGSSWF